MQTQKPATSVTEKPEHGHGVVKDQRDVHANNLNYKIYIVKARCFKIIIAVAIMTRGWAIKFPYSTHFQLSLPWFLNTCVHICKDT